MLPTSYKLHPYEIPFQMVIDLAVLDPQVLRYGQLRVTLLGQTLNHARFVLTGPLYLTGHRPCLVHYLSSLRQSQIVLLYSVSALEGLPQQLGSLQVFGDEYQPCGWFVQPVRYVDHVFLESCGHEGENVVVGVVSALHRKPSWLVEHCYSFAVEHCHRLQHLFGSLKVELHMLWVFLSQKQRLYVFPLSDQQLITILQPVLIPIYHFPCLVHNDYVLTPQMLLSRCPAYRCALQIPIDPFAHIVGLYWKGSVVLQVGFTRAEKGPAKAQPFN